MESKLNIDPKMVDSARQHAANIAKDMQEFIDAHTTVSTERTILRLLGVDGVDDVDTPLPNVVVDQIKLQESKTKLMAQVIKALGAEDQKALLVLEGRDESVIRASKNIPTIKDAYVNTINVYDLLNADKIIVLKGAMQDIQEVYA